MYLFIFIVFVYNNIIVSREIIKIIIKIIISAFN